VFLRTHISDIYFLPECLAATQNPGSGGSPVDVMLLAERDERHLLSMFLQGDLGDIVIRYVRDQI